jgi:UDP-N-acetylglucosamine/UDP-N-acetylgalactosamine diphosphorylase
MREGCILEEQSSGAHCVGLKQTILFPYVTLGSLINFCDCLMAGGTGRRNHSEVGSSYIHFNFTPEGDKATPSLLGDVPRGVMLNQPPIFLGGQGGLVGPLRVGYGNVVAAGTILRRDVLERNKLIIGKTHQGLVTDYVPRTYHGLNRIVKNNVFYLANLMALEQWYIHVRRPFFASQELGEAVYRGLLETLALSQRERAGRLKSMADIIAGALDQTGPRGRSADRKREFCEAIAPLCEDLDRERAGLIGADERELFLTALREHVGEKRGPYLEVIQGLPLSVAEQGVRWLERIVHGLCRTAAARLPSFALGEE